MVGPITDEERRAGSLKLQAALVLLVAVSAVTITLQAEPSTEQLVAVAVAGLLVGVVLSWYVTRTLREFTEDTR